MSVRPSACLFVGGGENATTPRSTLYHRGVGATAHGNNTRLRRAHRSTRFAYAKRLADGPVLRTPVPFYPRHPPPEINYRRPGHRRPKTPPNTQSVLYGGLFFLIIKFPSISAVLKI